MPTQLPSLDELSRAMDPEVALTHEDLTSPFVDDAVHWLAVYKELIGMNVALLKRAGEMLAGASADAVKASNFDLRLLRAQAERYQARRGLWANRAKEILAGGHPDLGVGGVSLMQRRDYNQQLQALKPTFQDF